MQVTLTDAFWAPRLRQLRDRTIEVVLERLERQGAVDNLRRLSGGHDAPRRAMHFSDSDVYKWLEAACLAGRLDLATPVAELVVAAQQADGYLHSHYGLPGAPGRYTDLEFGHEHYCFGHLIEAAVAHHEATGTDDLLAVARRLADHLLDGFGPGSDERVDAHPEVELALCRLASVAGEERYVAHAAWAVEQHLATVGRTIDDWPVTGHAVRVLYLTSAVAEVARATGDERWRTAAARLYGEVLDRHSYPTGAVGGRWLGEAVGKPFEQPDAMSYTESCGAVAAAQLSWRMWQLTADPRALDQLELLLFNAVPCGVGADGASWFYSQPHAVAEVTAEDNPWLYGFDYGMLMLREWFPARRHRWFDVPCCPPNLARMFASVDRYMAEVDAAGDLLVHLPLAGRIEGEGWDVSIGGGYPDDGDVTIEVHAAPAGRSVRVRRPGWAGGAGHEPVGADGRVVLPVDPTWWTTSSRVEGLGGTVHLRRGPVVHCVEGADNPGVDLRGLVVDPDQPPERAFRLRPEGGGDLHRPFGSSGSASEPVEVTTRPYATWANGDPTTMRLRFPVA